MRIWRMTNLVSAAPGGASMPGTEIAGPPGCASGTGGRSNRSRSRPGWSLGGTICAPGGTTCATAASETLTIPKAAATVRTPTSMPPAPRRTEQNFMSGKDSKTIAGSPCHLSRFGNFCRCFNKVTQPGYGGVTTSNTTGSGHSNQQGLPVVASEAGGLVARRPRHLAGLHVLDHPREHSHHFALDALGWDQGSDYAAQVLGIAIDPTRFCKPPRSEHPSCRARF